MKVHLENKVFCVLKTTGIQPMEGHDFKIEPLFNVSISIVYLFNISSATIGATATVSISATKGATATVKHQFNCFHTSYQRGYSNCFHFSYQRGYRNGLFSYNGYNCQNTRYGRVKDTAPLVSTSVAD